MKTSAEIRAEAWKALCENGQYLRYVSAYLLLMMVTVVVSIPLMAVLGIGIGLSGIAPFFAPGGHPEIGLLLDPNVMLPLGASLLVFSLLAMYPIGFVMWGQAAMAIAAMRRGLTVGHALSGWGNGWKMGWTETVKILYLHLWSLLFVIPALVKFCSYAMTEFIAVDHPDWTANQCITESRRLMDGHKMRYFCMLLSFIGWVLLVMIAGMLPLVGGLAQWFFMPYIESAKAAFYEELLDLDAMQS
jgi:uncharacterized membrane protein